MRAERSRSAAAHLRMTSYSPRQLEARTPLARRPERRAGSRTIAGHTAYNSQAPRTAVHLQAHTPHLHWGPKPFSRSPARVQARTAAHDHPSASGGGLEASSRLPLIGGLATPSAAPAWSHAGEPVPRAHDGSGGYLCIALTLEMKPLETVCARSSRAPGE